MIIHCDRAGCGSSWEARLFPGKLCPVCALAKWERLRAKPKKPPPPKAGSARAGIIEGIAELLPALIQLCHPDRHGNSQAANRATQWLLKTRKTLRNLPKPHEGMG